jgi:DNA-binding beta-propeller fold protein YncE
MVRIRAPEFPQDFDWLNSPPLSLWVMRGHYILLDFWTHGCINCIHVIPAIKALTQRFPDLKLISIHSGKFDREQEITSLEAAIAKYQITHPVVADRDQKIWQDYTVRAYPTFVLIDPAGYLVLTRSGEQGLSAIAAAIADNLTAQDQPVNPIPQVTQPLAFPGKICGTKSQIFISDSGQRRVLWLARQMQQVQIIPNFANPQGLTHDPIQQILYVADPGRHCIDAIDLKTLTKTRIAGTGQQSKTLAPHGGKALAVALNSPWDLVLVGQQLFIAMAGSHQIWQLDLLAGTIATFVGSGAEGCYDGLPAIAAFAQPSGIATDGRSLYVADCESSSIRQIDLATGVTQTICGLGNLYAFGDRDGRSDRAKLQHPMGLAYANNKLWIADTYNHKIKQFDLVTQECITVADGFLEPNGIAIDDDILWIADTNQHQIWVLQGEERRRLEWLDPNGAGTCNPV